MGLTASKGWLRRLPLTLLPAVVFSLGGAGKLLDPYPATVALVEMRPMQPSVARDAVLGLASVELMIALGLLLAPVTKRAALCGGVLGAALLLLSLVRDLAGLTADCGCFGAVVLPGKKWTQTPLLFLVVALCVILALPRQQWVDQGECP